MKLQGDLENLRPNRVFDLLFGIKYLKELEI